MFFTDVAPVIHPLVIQEDLVSRFCYWNELVQEGMYFNGELYTYFRSFPAVHRLNAYAVAYEQIEQGNTVCVTASDSRYVIWFCLRAQPSLGSIDSVSKNLGVASTDRASQKKKAACLESEHLVRLTA